MANSATPFLNIQRKKKDDKAAIYLCMIIGRKIKYINLDVSWYPDFFSDGRCMPVSKTDPLTVV